MIYRPEPIIEERFCICGAARQESFPYGTRPLVRRRHSSATKAEPAIIPGFGTRFQHESERDAPHRSK